MFLVWLDVGLVELRVVVGLHVIDLGVLVVDLRRGLRLVDRGLLVDRLLLVGWIHGWVVEV